MKNLDTYWYSQNPVAWLLLPVSWFYCALVILRRWLYRTGILKSYQISVPLVIIGNISVGGTGKTPLLIALCDLLKKQGINPGIVSRGYGGNFTGQRLVDSSDTPVSVGDEPFLIAQRTQCPVVVGKNRVAAAELLLKHHTCDVILSDDGLQHYRMQRDLEIAVVDVKRQFGNGFCLPAGSLRESVSRLKSVDMVVYHGQTTHDDCFLLEFSEAVNLVTRETRPVASFQNSPVHVVAGIGYPERFFEQLEQAGLTVIKHPFPDHHAYNESDLCFDERGDKKALLMTEKDAVKCKKFTADNNWYIPVTAKLSDHLISSFLDKIKQSIDA
jgi:tetraacyldisaccharide 4'-kinase